MIVVGCRGHGALRRALLGSVSTALVHHAHGPVAVVHDEAAPPDAASRAPVLVGIDGSPASESATAIAFDEASRRGVDLVALHSWSDADRLDDFVVVEWSTIQSSAEETLAERLAGWQERYPDVSVHRVVTRDHPARHLLSRPKPHNWSWSAARVGADSKKCCSVGSHRRRARRPHAGDRGASPLSSAGAQTGNQNMSPARFRKGANLLRNNLVGRHRLVFAPIYWPAPDSSVLRISRWRARRPDLGSAKVSC